MRFFPELSRPANHGDFEQFSPAGVHRHAASSGSGPFWTSSLDVVGRNRAIGIVLSALRNADDRERYNEIVDRQHIHAMPIGREMQRRVHVRAGVLDDHPTIDVELILRISQERFFREPFRPVKCRKAFIADESNRQRR